jgi:glycosyl-4,4'-diaponeurosporenoate acyltransferase
VATTNNLILAVAGGAAWGVWSSLCGFAAHRVPRERLERDAGILRLRKGEADGRAYERVLRIKRWKDRLPEAGALFRGGFSKRRIVRHDRAYLVEFAVATRRAELAHWAIVVLAPTFFVWMPLFGMPWWLATAMFAYGVVANSPCILVQRYNRARVERVLRPTPGRDSVPSQDASHAREGGS